MSLVAYGSSDESEEDEEVKSISSPSIPSVCKSSDSDITTRPFNPSTGTNSILNLNSEIKLVADGKEQKENESRSDTIPSLFQNLPQPKQDDVAASCDQDDIESHTDIPVLALLPLDVPQSGNKIGVGMRKKAGPVKITLPSLSQFTEDEDEPIKKKLKPSIKGSGLFAMLPPPKNVKSRDAQQPLIPHILTKKTLPALPVPSDHVNKMSKQSLLEVDYESEDEEDFFSLNSVNKLPEERNVELSRPTTADVSMSSTSNLTMDFRPKNETGPIYNVMTQKDHHTTAFPSSANIGTTKIVQGSSRGSHYTYVEEEMSNDPAVGVQEGNISLAPSDLQLNAEAMQRLCGRRSKKNQEPVEIIDVNGTEIMPNPSEWLIKQLSEEQPKMRSHSHKRNDGPTTQQRRKHQITYLAFQAKENELELKNQWSQNRMTRKQTQSKYGF